MQGCLATVDAVDVVDVVDDVDDGGAGAPHGLGTPEVPPHLKSVYYYYHIYIFFLVKAEICQKKYVKIRQFSFYC